MTGSGPDTFVLDHLALASRRAWDNVIRYCYHLGGRWLGGPSDPGEDPFYFAQVEFGGGTKLELLEPYPDPGSDFLVRFLQRSGPGPHHFTFKVADIHAAIARAERAGHRVVEARLDEPDWKEAFLHPKSSHGIVIQLAQQSPDAGWETPPPLPPTDQGSPSVIDQVQYLVADIDEATGMFVEVLGMTEESRDEGPAGCLVRLRSGPWNLVLLRPERGGPQQWLGDRTGRLLSVDITVDDPTVIPGLRPTSGGLELAPEVNLGTRLLLRRR